MKPPYTDRYIYGRTLRIGYYDEVAKLLGITFKEVKKARERHLAAKQ